MNKRAMRVCVGKERGGLRLRMGETRNPFIQREEATQREGLKGEGVGELRRAVAWGWRAEEGSRSRGEARVEGVNCSCSLFSLSLQEQKALGVAQA